MNRLVSIILVAFLAFSSMSCTHRDAAMIGTAVGKPMGYPLGETSVVVNEAFGTSSDIQHVSPRYASHRSHFRHHRSTHRSMHQQTNLLLLMLLINKFSS